MAPSPNNGKRSANNVGISAVRITAGLDHRHGQHRRGGRGVHRYGRSHGHRLPVRPEGRRLERATEIGTSDIPLATINALSAGNHTIYVRGKDAVGNWGATATTVLLIDKTAPTFTGISLAPSPTLGAANVTLTVNGAVDPLVSGLASGVAGGEYWINPPTTTDPAPGSGTQFSGLTATIPVGTLANGTYTVRARIRDAAGNWSTGTNGIRQAT